MKILNFSFLFAASFLFVEQLSTPAFAAENTASPIANQNIWIQETVGPVDAIKIGPNQPQMLDLLRWKTDGSHRTNPKIAYNREEQFGKWIHFRKTPGCFNVRAQVLIRDSEITATSVDEKKCTIEKGEWLDPYSGKTVYTDDQIQIDHMVPLKEAYIAGASQWSRAKRCVYANFMGMKDHLKSVSNYENLSKSDKTPEQYIPSNKDYVCEYLKNWLSVKLIWKLSLQPSEADAIKKHIKDYACDESKMQIDKSFVAKTRIVAQQLESLCPFPKAKTP